MAFARADLSPNSPAHYLFPSRQVSLDPEIRDYAARKLCARTPGARRRDRSDAADQGGIRLRDRRHHGTTTPPMSFALRRGVCQDFAHIMIRACAALGLPAAYVSGYLRTGAAAGKARLEGADAMHAWVLVWCGEEAGWFGLDPTNGIFAGDDHIVLAIGRDYADVAPIDGVIFASGGQRIDVSVSVRPVG